MTTPNLTWIANYIWGIADDVLRDVYVRGKYRDVILPMTVLRRLDAVLEPSNWVPQPDPAPLQGRLGGPKRPMTKSPIQVRRGTESKLYMTLCQLGITSLLSSRPPSPVSGFSSHWLPSWPLFDIARFPAIRSAAGKDRAGARWRGGLGAGISINTQASRTGKTHDNQL